MLRNWDIICETICYVEDVIGFTACARIKFCSNDDVEWFMWRYSFIIPLYFVLLFSFYFLPRSFKSQIIINANVHEEEYHKLINYGVILRENSNNEDGVF